ncbi:ribonucleoside-diphosphate reductase alpha subunit [Scheffersomyces xylosifermentans]|uniref:ribonucleoside-diphosphate reductase alpha subunit n=1 Tax=Scheffersomyces xylosifermentans TaxID=1304137 RepID=UPI00315DB7DC
MSRPQVVKVGQEEDGKNTRKEAFSKSKLLNSLISLSVNIDSKNLDIESVVESVYHGLPNEITVDELLELVSESLASKIIYHPDYSILAGRVEAHKIQKQINSSFSEVVIRLRKHKNGNSSRSSSLIAESFYNTVMKNREFLDNLIEKQRDFELTYFGIKTLQKSYLLKIDGKVAETPQFMFLRVAIGIHGDNMEEVVETYELMSNKYFIHASPTLYNAGTEYNYLSSCFLIAMEDDSIDGIYKTLHKAALISKASGGIGLHVHNIRGHGAHIASTNGTASGLVPMLKVFNDTARYVDQGGNKRPGAFAIYLEPWHSDVFEILDLKKNHGKEELRTRDLFFGLWIPDLFMERVKNNEDWSLFSPDEAPGLADCYGEEFVELYKKYEKEGRAHEVVKAQKLWHAILESQTETGGPYMLYKDACNSKSNQSNLGVIKSSNLCCEIVEYSSADETAVCNLGSLALPSFIKSVSSPNADEVLQFDFEKLRSITKVLTKNLNKVIDVTRYPIEGTEVSNKRHRPIALGVQGLADLFLELRLPFDSEEAKSLNIQIFETIYHGAIEASLELAMEDGPYETFKGSPASKGLLQFDLWNHKPSSLYSDWDELKNQVKVHGLRNSLLVAPMPTASTSQILGFNECFEPYTSNLYTRRVLSGEFQIVNKYLLKDLIDLGLWTSAMRNKIILENGSIQSIPNIPQEIKDLYKTVWEISQKVIVDMAADRGKFIDQSQSMNIHLQNPTFGKLTSCHFYAWNKGLKTGMYYLRTQAASRAIQFTVDTEEIKKLDNGVTVDANMLKRKRYTKIEEVVTIQGENPPNYTPKHKRNKLDYHTPESLNRSPVSADESKIGKLIDENYDIYDTTPVACELKDAEHCHACSG